MAKISPVSIKYMIHANLNAQGALEKPDVIGALFGQTEGLLGNELEMRELQKEGKIGRIEVTLERKDRVSIGTIKIPTALDQSETTLIAAAIETIERVGPCDAQIEVERIEDVRGSKRDYIIERAKKLMQGIQGSTDSREISNEIKDAAKIANISEYGDEKLPCGDLSGKEVIVVEGRADVINLLRNGVNNVIGMNGTKLPKGIKEISKDKELTLFVDGDRGGILIAQNVVENAEVAYITSAPGGKEVEELTGKEILQNLRKKVSAKEFLKNQKISKTDFKKSEEESKPLDLSNEDTNELKNLSKKLEGTNKAVLLNGSIKEIKTVSARTLTSELKRSRDGPAIIVIDGNVTKTLLEVAEEKKVQVIVAKNFSTTDTTIKLLSL